EIRTYLKWTVPPGFLTVFTVASESPFQLPAAVAEPTILAQASGDSLSTWERLDLNTIKVTEVGSSGGFLQLNFFPDGSYQLFSFVRSAQYGLAFGQITREAGKYHMTDDKITLTPSISRSETGVSSGGSQSSQNPTTARTYTVTQALFETLLSTGETNSGIVLRGPCPTFALPATCISSSSAEHRLQALTVSN
ncbi:MAG: hypothetical protein K2X47_04395, partial [Bdellovibrionales bacterium]|nr:hypothetical protein [Bdellovibrionales bacterium]